MIDNIMEQNNPSSEKEFELAHIIGLNSVLYNCVQAHPSMTETISYAVGGIIITEDLMDRNNQVFFRHGTNQISCFKISYSGKLLAVGFTTNSLDKILPANIIIWDFENKKVLYELTGITKAVKRIEFSPDDRFICALGVDNSLIIWESSNGNRCYHRVFEYNIQMVRWVRMVYEDKHPNYNIILSNINSIYDYYFVYDLKSMQYVMQCNKFSLPSCGFVRVFVSCIYDYNNKNLLCGTTGGEICLFNIEKHIYKGSFNITNNGANHLVVLNDSSVVVSGGDGKIKKLVYDESISNQNQKKDLANNYVLSYEIDLKKNITSMTLSADKKELIASNCVGEIYRIFAHDLSFSLHNENHHTSVNKCCYSFCNDNFYSVDDYGALIQWDLNNYTVLNKISSNGKDKATSVTIGEDASLFIGYSNGSLKNYDSNMSGLLWELPAHRGKINVVYVDGNYILTGGEDGTVRVWTRKTHELVMEFAAHHKEVHSLFADRNCPNIIYSGGEDKTMNCFDLKLQKRVLVHNLQNGFIFDMDQKHDGDFEIVSVGFNSGFCVWDFYKIDPIMDLQLNCNFFAIKISHSGKYLAAGNDIGEIWIFLASEYKLIGKASGHSHRINCISWSPDDKQIISTSIDFSISVWNIYLN